MHMCVAHAASARGMQAAALSGNVDASAVAQLQWRTSDRCACLVPVYLLLQQSAAQCGLFTLCTSEYHRYSICWDVALPIPTFVFCNQPWLLWCSLMRYHSPMRPKETPHGVHTLLTAFQLCLQEFRRSSHRDRSYTAQAGLCQQMLQNQQARRGCYCQKMKLHVFTSRCLPPT